MFQLADQVTGENAGVGRNVIDRLFRVQGGALAPERIQHVHHMTFDPHHPALENGEQADGAAPDNAGVGVMKGLVNHGRLAFL
ncbi:hypothetical protein GCM10027396_08170 [Insolitispirillum peregrinum]